MITTTFLVLGLLFPRLTLLFTYLFGNMPDNSTPFAADVLCAILMPRFLIAFWVYEQHLNAIWIVLYVFFGIAELFVRPGQRTTTIRRG